MDDTTPVETAPVAPSNEPSTTSAPPVDNTSAVVEAAKKEAEQARIRANQLENENAKMKADQEAAQRKQLEEKEEFKTLYEKTQARLDELTAAQEEALRKQELTAATDELLKAYPTNVVEIAQTAGISLTDDSDAAKAVFKEKLDTLTTKVGSGTPTINPNNPGVSTDAPFDRSSLTVKGEKGVSEMALASARGDDAPITKYINSLSAIKEMKRQAGINPDA
jgi:hypothetical protein